MKNKSKYLITTRFPPWGYKDGKPDEYPAFAIRYLIEMPNERLNYEEEVTEDPVITYFKEKYKQVIGQGKDDFKGEVLFVEEFECAIL